MVPDGLKIAKVIPLFKSGSLNSIDNYRPISVLSTVSKIMERAVYDQLSEYLEQQGLLSESQYGFRKGYNTEIAVTVFTDNIRRAIDSGKMTGAVFIDLRKAFDTGEHKVLMSKLPLKGIVGGELKWIGNYLTDRYQCVQYDGVKSDRELVKYGVPQGSILGPLLFLLQINDLAKIVRNCNIQMYADDTVIYTSHSNVSNIEQTLTSEMNNVSKWLNKNRLIINLNKGKTESLLFGTAKRLCSKDPMEVYMNEKRIKVADGYKYLGVWLEPTLNMNENLRRVLKKANT